MTGANDRRVGALSPELLQALREADAWLADRRPACALEQRILAAPVATRGAPLLRFALLAVPAAVLAFLAFTRSPSEVVPLSGSEANRVLQLPTRAGKAIRRSAPGTADGSPPDGSAVPPEPDGSQLELEPEPELELELPDPTPSSVSEPTPTPAAEPTPAASGEPAKVYLAPVHLPGQETASPTAWSTTGRSGPTATGGRAASNGAPTTAHAERPGSGPRPPPVPRAPRDEVDPHDEVELHVFGIYTAYNEATGEEGETAVHISRPGRHIIVLAAYSGTRWTVTADEDVEVVHVLAVGYEPQSIAAAPADASRETLDAVAGDYLGCGYQYPHASESGCDTAALLARLELLLDTSVASFHGCVVASMFTLAEDFAVTSDCWDEDGYTLTGFP